MNADGLLRFRYTILLVLIIVGCLVLIGWRSGLAEDCQNRGGEYVETWSGYRCVGGDS